MYGVKLKSFSSFKKQGRKIFLKKLYMLNINTFIIGIKHGSNPIYIYSRGVGPCGPPGRGGPWPSRRSHRTSSNMDRSPGPLDYQGRSRACSIPLQK